MIGSRFSLRRLNALVIKEFIQMRRDRLTFAMIIGLPVIQLLLFLPPPSSPKITRYSPGLSSRR